MQNQTFYRIDARGISRNLHFCRHRIVNYCSEERVERVNEILFINIHLGCTFLFIYCIRQFSCLLNRTKMQWATSRKKGNFTIDDWQACADLLSPKFISFSYPISPLQFTKKKQMWNVSDLLSDRMTRNQFLCFLSVILIYKLK